MIPAWEQIVEEGWGAEVAAGLILHDIRVENDLVRARWLWARLQELCEGKVLARVARERKSGRQITVGRANAISVRLKEILTPEQLAQIR